MSMFDVGTTTGTQPEVLQGRVISVSGGKGGVGKTFFSVNFATELQSLGYKVLIFDGDIDLSNINLLLNIDENSRFKDFLDHKIEIQQLVRKGVGGVDVIYVGDDLNESLRFSDEEFVYFSSELEKLEKSYDFIIIDTSAGLSTMNRRLVESSESVVMIANQEITSLVDLYKTIKIFAAHKSNLTFRIVVNKCPSPEKAAQIYQGLAETLTANKVPANVDFLGYILDDPKRALASIQRRTPLALLEDSGSLQGCFRLVVRKFLETGLMPRKKQSLFRNLFFKEKG